MTNTVERKGETQLNGRKDKTERDGERLSEGLTICTMLDVIVDTKILQYPVQ